MTQLSAVGSVSSQNVIAQRNLSVKKDTKAIHIPTNKVEKQQGSGQEFHIKDSGKGNSVDLTV